VQTRLTLQQNSKPIDPLSPGIPAHRSKQRTPAHWIDCREGVRLCPPVHQTSQFWLAFAGLTTPPVAADDASLALFILHTVLTGKSDIGV